MTASEYLGRNITDAEMHEDKLVLAFDDGVKIAILDAGQQCCENRYMRTDDDVKSLIGHKIVRIDVKEGQDIDEDEVAHEVCFLEIGTEAGFITIANHNEHNGYYGGFSIEIREVRQ